MPLTILFAGNYEPDYNRTKIIKSGLKKLGHKLLEFPFKKRNSETASRLLSLSKTADFVYLPSFTHKDVPFVKKNAGGKKLIFDPMVSRYVTKVFDYKKHHKYSLAAILNLYYDKRALNAADFIVTDTMAHLEYFNSKYGVPKTKLGVLYIGNDFDKFFPGEAGRKKSETVYTAGFYGGFIPLQGVMNILGAAKLLKEDKSVSFRLIGTGFEYKKALAYAAHENLSNVEFPGWLSEKDLCEKIRNFDCALGIFGETIKTDLVIPNKLYHYAACAKPVITKNTPAVRELFKDGEDLILVNGSPDSIVEAILRLRDNPLEARAIADKAYEKIKTDLNETKVAGNLINFFSALTEK